MPHQAVIILYQDQILSWLEGRWQPSRDDTGENDIQTPIFMFKLGTNIAFFTFKIVFFHSEFGTILSFYIQNPILTFQIVPNIKFRYSKPSFDILIGTKCCFFTFIILFWHSNLSLL